MIFISANPYLKFGTHIVLVYRNLIKTYKINTAKY